MNKLIIGVFFFIIFGIILSLLTLYSVSLFIPEGIKSVDDYYEVLFGVMLFSPLAIIMWSSGIIGTIYLISYNIEKIERKAN